MVDHHAWQGGSFTTFSVRATLLCLGHKSRFLQTPFDPGVAARATRAFVPVMEVFDAPAHVSATILVGGKFGRVTVRNLRPSITRTTLLRAAKVYGQFLDGTLTRWINCCYCERLAPFICHLFSLEDAVDTMGRLQLGRKFTKEENVKIVAFLKSLTGKQPKFMIPIFSPSTKETPKPKPFG